MKKITTYGEKPPPIDPLSRQIHDQWRGNQQALREQYGERIFGPLPKPEPKQEPEPPKVEAHAPKPEPDTRTEQERLDDAEIDLLVAQHRARVAEGQK